MSHDDGGVNNWPKQHDVIYERSLISFYYLTGGRP